MEQGEHRSRLDAIVGYVLSVVLWFTRFFLKHWLALANVALALSVIFPLAAPLLMHAGYERAGRIAYLVYSPFCHQIPERSFFLFGREWVYSYGELARALRGDVPRRFMGNALLGYKMAICQRDMAIYAIGLASGLLFGLVRHRWRRITLRWFALMSLPMAVDGFGQLFGLWTSTWVSRLATGGLFGFAMVRLAFPLIEEALAAARNSAVEHMAGITTANAARLFGVARGP